MLWAVQENGIFTNRGLKPPDQGHRTYLISWYSCHKNYPLFEGVPPFPKINIFCRYFAFFLSAIIAIRAFARPFKYPDLLTLFHISPHSFHFLTFKSDYWHEI